MLGLGNGGVVFAEQWVPSGLAAVIVATSPFWMATVEACLPDGERLRRRVVAGLVDRLQRDRVLVWPELTLGIARAAAGFSPASSRCRSRRSAGRSGRRTRSGTAARRQRQRPRRRSGDGMDEVLGTTAYQMLAGGLMMIAAGTLRGEWASALLHRRGRPSRCSTCRRLARSAASSPTPMRCDTCRCRSCRSTPTSIR